MDEGIDNEAMDTSDSVEEIDQSYSPDIIDDIEQQIKQDPEQTVSGISLGNIYFLDKRKMGFIE